MKMILLEKLHCIFSLDLSQNIISGDLRNNNIFKLTANLVLFLGGLFGVLTSIKGQRKQNKINNISNFDSKCLGNNQVVPHPLKFASQFSKLALDGITNTSPIVVRDEAKTGIQYKE